MTTVPTARCVETAGFLFSHACPRTATGQCTRCHKHVCTKHSVTSRDGGASPLCVSCAKKDHRRARRHRHHHHDHDDYYYDNDPYFYSAVYYSHYGYYGHGSWGYHHYHHGADPHDFSEADAANLYEDGDDFEHDMGAS